MHRALFLCSKNKWRSPTAEHVFADRLNVETDSAGLSQNAEVRLSAEHLEWATIIFVMEKNHRRNLSRKFARHLKDKRIICLNIPDNYQYLDPDLIGLLEKKAAPFLR